MILNQRNSPFKHVFRTLPFGLSRHPDFKVLDSVIVSNPVLVVDILEVLKRPSKMLLHHMTMLQDRSSLDGTGDIAGLALDIPTVRTFELPYFSSDFVCAFRRTASDVSGWLTQKFLAACNAVFRHESTGSCRLSFAETRTVRSPMMRWLYGKFLLAMRTNFLDLFFAQREFRLSGPARSRAEESRFLPVYGNLEGFSATVAGFFNKSGVGHVRSFFKWSDHNTYVSC